MNEGIVMAGKVIIFIGVIFDLLGCIGLVRLPDVYNRLQAATKCVTLGTCLILFGTFLAAGFLVKSLLVIIFVVLSSPTAAHAIAHAAHKSKIKLWEKSVVDRFEEEKEKV
jgi:multicomponent Na+:H+ antiporter subunit G